MFPTSLRNSTVIVIATIWLASSALADTTPSIDWKSLPVEEITLFYPGQSSFQWLHSQEHPGARKVGRGTGCTRCHNGDEQSMGKDIVSGGQLEPNPIEGKKGSLRLAIQAAHDEENLYLRFNWRTQADRPGIMHNYMRYDGQAWAFYGGPRSAKRVRQGQEPPLYEDRLAVMIDDGDVQRFAEQGCWLSCHNGMRDMPGEPTTETVRSHPYLGDGGLGRKDVRKYIPVSRTDASASWDKVKPAEVLAQIKERGVFLELMQWRAARSNPVDMADDGYVLGYRLFDEGQNPFSWNVDRDSMIPKYMFDPEKVGRKSLTIADIESVPKPAALIREENATLYDPDADWREGDVLPGRLLSRVDARGSAADNTRIRGKWEDGNWVVTWIRPLDTGNSDDIALERGNTYTFGFAIHDDNVTTRFHFVSFPVSVGIGRGGDITAVSLE
ncbi:hypothetical protein KFJ24_14635 [Marinobacter sediminum]|uniref:ethylbenzene dehydrogenase-related protein n=1 Tax=Marinobacter sediminum TaxID=256323 RepID=UPI002030413C|nr:ethylbenzene dehydrogenase-related protein [Marinobacter sediminum]MCM0613719.1 hypothetical protein [Marinobacter sediminum]